jgi:hypothetical protein
MATLSMQRTLKLLTEGGMTAINVERFNHFAGAYGHKEDFMGFIDIIAMSSERGIVGVQACGQDWAPHVAKIQNDCRPQVDVWTQSGGKVWLVGWRKLKKRKADGKKGKVEVWTPRVAEWNHDALYDVEIEPGYICAACARRRGGRWPTDHCATSHYGACGTCELPSDLCSVGDYDWPEGSSKPERSGGRD